MQNVLEDKETGDEFWAGHQLEKPQKPGGKALERKWKRPKEKAEKSLRNQAENPQKEGRKPWETRPKELPEFRGGVCDLFILDRRGVIPVKQI